MHGDSRGNLEQAREPGGCMSSFTRVSADGRATERKGKLFSVPDSWGKEKDNDIGNVDCYLPSGIVPMSGSECVCVSECVGVVRGRGWSPGSLL